MGVKIGGRRIEKGVSLGKLEKGHSLPITTAFLIGCLETNAGS